jgi:hypothetical protein
MNKEKLAEQYAEECNSCYINDYDGFIAGWEACLLSFPAEKRIKQKIKDSLNMYKSRLRDEKYIKLTKTINQDKVRELEIRIETLNKLL